MMKKLLILTAVVMLASGTAGCRCCDWLWRGAAYNPYPSTPAYGDPCPTYNPCDPCATGAPAIIPGPAPYAGATIQ